jgi:MFS transporter, LPLT family, lysophospholipid transporter
MNKNVKLLLLAQFITAFTDNAILFVAIEMAKQTQQPEWYLSGLQACFLVAFVVLAPWVGPFADRRAKSSILSLANWVKAGGAVLFLGQLEPLLAYAIVGVGAAIYSPAKYGILPELVDEHDLVKANGWIEGSTILAIVAGMPCGAWLAEQNTTAALGTIFALYIISGAMAFLIAKIPPKNTEHRPALPHFLAITRQLLATDRARFATLGVSIFWGAAAVLRICSIVFIGTVLQIHDTTQQSLMFLFTTGGTIVGALLAPMLIPLDFLRRSRLAAYAMGIAILGLSVMTNTWGAAIMLFLAGLAGGLFVVPINAALQEIGHRTVGAGGAVAVQHFFENLAMVCGTIIFALAQHEGAHPASAMRMLGIVVLIATFVITWHLPPDPARRESGLHQQ